MKNPAALTALSLRKAPSPSLAVVESLLEQLCSPAMVVDARNGKVMLANSYMAELTAFTRLDLARMDLNSLFQGLQRNWLAEAFVEIPAPVDVPLERYKSQPVLVQVTPASLDPQKKWVLLVVEPVSVRESRFAEQVRKDCVWEAVQELATLPQHFEDPEILEKTLQAGAALIGAEVLSIYLGEKADYMLSQRASLDPENVLPAQVHPQDIVTLQVPHIWYPRRRSISGLHRAARAAGMTYLATTPLGQQNAWIGLVAAGSKHSPHPEKVLDLLEILGSTITTILQNQAISTTLEGDRRNHSIQSAFTTALIDSIQDGVIVLRPDACVLELNQAAESILGFTTGEIAGQPYTSVLIGAEDVLPDLLALKIKENPVDLGNIKLFRRDGRTFLAHLRVAPICAFNDLENLLVLLQDLSQEEQFRIQNEQLQQRAILGEVTAIFAHEVRNPVNSISTGLQLLAMKLPPEDSLQEDISRVIQDCDRLAELMKSVLTFAKPMEYNLVPVDLNRSLSRLLDRWKPTLVKTNIEAELIVEPRTPLAAGDVRALEQVWNNLISNAINAMRGRGGKLSIKVRPILTPDNTQRVEVSISDTGCGIPEEIRDRLFEPFVTSDTTNGTGLGLSITRHIISTHKGSIRLTSIPGGTVFQVQLPAANPKG